MSGVSVVTHSAAETRALGESLGALLVAGDVVLLAGGLGAGKTELTKGIGAALEIDDVIVSPTFTLARRYPGRVSLLHVDLYRLDRVQELFDLGLEDEGEGAVTVIEWGDVASAHLPAERLEVQIDVVGASDDRMVTLTPQGPTWLERDAELTRIAHGLV